MRPTARSLAPILLIDIVGSTERAAELRDGGWRDIRQEHDRRIRRELWRFRGQEINTAGVSFLAIFEGTAGAIASPDEKSWRAAALGSSPACEDDPR